MKVKDFIESIESWKESFDDGEIMTNQIHMNVDMILKILKRDIGDEE